MNRVVVVAALLLSGVIVACSGANGDEASPTTSVTTEPVTSTTTTEATTTSTSTPAPVTTIARPVTPDLPIVAFDGLRAGSLAGRTITIDPGHDGANYQHMAEINSEVWIGNAMKACDTTGTATYSGYSETAHNWDVAVRLGSLLRGAGATVVFTRPDDSGWGPCIDRRAAIGNEARSDLAVSIHADGGPDGGRGFHVLYPVAVAGNDAIVGPSSALATSLRDAYGARTGMLVSDYLGSGGLMARSDLGGLNLSTVPKVFLEAGNMRNATDAALLVDAGFRQREAEGLAVGIARFLGVS